MKKLTLITLGILVLIGVVIGFIACLFWGEFNISIIVVSTFGMLIIGIIGADMLSGDVLSPWANSWLYGTDFATGEIITELQKMNRNNENKK